MKKYRLKYVLRSYVKKNNESSIRLRLIFSRKTIYFSLGKTVPLYVWDKENEKLHEYADTENINQYLYELKKTVSLKLDHLFVSGILNDGVIKNVIKQEIENFNSFGFSDKIKEDEVLKLAIPVIKKGTSGVYLLLLNSKVVYIGKTTNFYKRLSYHIDVRFFDSYVFIPCTEDELNFTEASLIRKYKNEGLDNKILF